MPEAGGRQFTIASPLADAALTGSEIALDYRPVAIMPDVRVVNREPGSGSRALARAWQ